MASYGEESVIHRVTLSMSDVIDLVQQKGGRQIPDTSTVTWLVDRQWSYPLVDPNPGDALVFEWTE